jgi:hypothetical protein
VVKDKKDSLLAEVESSFHVSEIIEEMGFSCFESTTVLKDLLSQFPPLTERDLGLILGIDKFQN